MTKAMVLVVAAGALLLAGCGASKRELDELRAEQNRALDQVRAEVQSLATQVGRLRDDLRELDADLFELSGQLGYSPAAESSGETFETRESATTTRPPSGATAVEEVAVEPLHVETLGELAAEVAKLRAELATLRQQMAVEREMAELLDPRKTWEAMNDPKKLSWRLDRFAKTWSANVDDEVQRAQFVADVEALKTQLEERASLSNDELVNHYRAKLTERVNSETNQRMRLWYEQELRMLNQGDERVISSKLKTYVRYDAAQGLKELAEKYKISSDDLRNNGLQTYGGAYGWK
jgi:outer membrane murein-binding lipoprotein Lpp